MNFQHLYPVRTDIRKIDTKENSILTSISAEHRQQVIRTENNTIFPVPVTTSTTRNAEGKFSKNVWGRVVDDE